LWDWAKVFESASSRSFVTPTSFFIEARVYSIALLLFIVLDPFGNLVTLNTLLRNHQPPMRRRIMLRESAIALGILLVATFCGEVILKALGLHGYALELPEGSSYL
jgi:small neutral amino acid transporter SnatA (MarC family)